MSLLRRAAARTRHVTSRVDMRFQVREGTRRGWSKLEYTAGMPKVAPEREHNLPCREWAHGVLPAQ